MTSAVRRDISNIIQKIGVRSPVATDQKTYFVKTGCISSSVKRLVTGVTITVPRRYRYQRMQRVKEGVARYIKKPSQLAK